MTGPAVAALAATSPAWLGEQGALVALAVSLGLLLLVSLLLATTLLGRRQQRNEMREIVSALEELRSGRTQERVRTDPRSPSALVADAVNRLAQDLAARWGRSEHAARQLEALLGALADHAVIEADADWDVRRCTPGTSGLFGWSERELSGRSATKLFEAESWKNVLPKLARRSAREHGVLSRARMARQDGSLFDADVLIRTHRGSDGEPAGYVLVVRDVSAAVRRERELRDAEARYRALVDALHEGVAIARRGRLIYANASLARLLDTTVDQLDGAELRRFVSTADLLVLREALDDRPERAGPAELPATLVTSRGNPLDVRIGLRVVEDADGPATLITVHDVSATIRARGALELNEARLDAVLESTADGVVVLSADAEGRAVTMTNAAFLGMFELRQEQVLGAPRARLAKLLRQRGGGAEDVATFLEEATAGAQDETIALEDEPPRSLSLHAAPLSAADGHSLGTVLVCRDLTDQRAVERQLEARAEELQRSKEELQQAYGELAALDEQRRHRVEQLDKLNSELRELDEMKSNLLANVSHELQTPLVSIRGYTEMILKGRLGAITEEQSKGLRLSLSNIDRLISMIDNLLQFARMDREAAELELTNFPLQPLIEESVALLRDQVEQRGLTVDWQLHDPDVSIHADRDKVLQVLLNLVGNAVKFNRDGGAVEIRVSDGEPGFVELRVRDTGPGIPAEALDRIFDRFYRAEKPGEPGTGIGLAIVRNILRLHGCSIRAESVPGEGSTFVFSLPAGKPRPRAQPDAATPHERSREASPPAPATEHGPRSADPSPEDEPRGPRRRFRIIRRD